jgi:hypothetical protein
MVPNCVPEHTWGIVARISEGRWKEKSNFKHLREKNVPTNPALWSKMKSRAKAKFDVYPYLLMLTVGQQKNIRKQVVDGNL